MTLFTTSMLDYHSLGVASASEVSLFDFWCVTWSEFKPLWDRLDFIFGFFSTV